MEILNNPSSVPSLALADGRAAQPDKLRQYFDGLLHAEDSGEEFPVELAHVWPIGYTRKDAAVRALLDNASFAQGIDYQVFHRIPENSKGGRPSEEYRLSVSCLEFLVVRANREVFEVYRACRQAVRRALLPNFADPAAAARAWADEHEAKQHALAVAEQTRQQLVEAQPKIAFFDHVAVSTNALSFEKAAKWLKLPGLEGRNKLIRRLKADKILQKNRSPYQRYVNEGIFEVEPQTYQAGKHGEKGRRLASTTRVTGKGLEWLADRYRAA